MTRTLDVTIFQVKRRVDVAHSGDLPGLAYESRQCDGQTMLTAASNFGDRLTWIRVNLFHEDSERAFARELGLRSETQIGNWRSPINQQPRLDMVVRIWDHIGQRQPWPVSLLWFVTGRGEPLATVAPETLHEAIREKRPSKAVEEAAFAFYRQTRAPLSAHSWSILLDKWAAVEAEGIRLSEGPSKDGQGGNEYTPMFDVTAVPAPRSTATRAKRLGRPAPRKR